MTTPDKPLNDAELQRKASRARWLLYIAMFLGIAAPFILVWWIGAFSF